MILIGADCPESPRLPQLMGITRWPGRVSTGLRRTYPANNEWQPIPPQLLSPACTLLPQHAAILAPSAYLKQTICLALDFPNQTILTPWEPGDPVPASPQLALYATGPNSHQQMLVGAWEDCSWGVVHRFILPLESEGPGQLLLVRDGIVSNPSPRPDWPPGLIGITCDSRLSTDASALIIVNDDAMQVVASEMLQRAGPMLKQIRSMLDPIHPLLEGHLTFHQALRLTNRLAHLINP